MGKLLKKEDLTRFLYKLKQKGDLIAPVKKNIVRFEKIDDIKKIHLDSIPNFSIKNYFTLKNDPIFKFDSQKTSKVESSNDLIIFGVRHCDLNSLLRMDKIFLDPRNPDSFYKTRREKTILIGYNCATPDENCFCESMGLENYHDLFFYEMGDNYYIDVGSEKGLKLVSRLKDYDYNPRGISCNKKLNKKLLLKHFNDPLWGELSKNCLSCGKCTLVCPTCYCFNMLDELKLTLDKGERLKVWDSCQYKDFTEVSGGFIFRDPRMERLRHRIYHKLLYFRQRFSKDMCVGCGKCITICPTKIDFIEGINQLK